MDVVEFAEFCEALGMDPMAACARFLEQRRTVRSAKKVALQQG